MIMIVILNPFLSTQARADIPETLGTGLGFFSRELPRVLGVEFGV